MQLVEQGLLDLDAPLRTYLPELKLADESVAANVTMRHLFTTPPGGSATTSTTSVQATTLARMIDALATLPQLTPLGEIWSYNNAGFYIAGRVIELLTGKTYEQAVHDVLLEPLGLDNTFFFAEEVMTRRFAVVPSRGRPLRQLHGPGRSVAPPIRPARSLPTCASCCAGRGSTCRTAKGSSRAERSTRCSETSSPRGRSSRRSASRGPSQNAQGRD